MRNRPIQRLGTWLCFVAALVMALAPARALVFCFGPDGTIALELSLGTGPCEGCPEIAPKGCDAGVVATRDAAGGCPCVDVPVGDPNGAAKAKPKAHDLRPLGLAAIHVAPEPAHGTHSARRGLFRAAPGPDVAPVLALIRSTVLLV